MVIFSKIVLICYVTLTVECTLLRGSKSLIIGKIVAGTREKSD